MKSYNKDKVGEIFGLPGIIQTDGSGKSLTEAAEAAVEEGYIKPGPNGVVDETTLLDKLLMEDAGRESFTPEGDEAVAQQQYEEYAEEQLARDAEEQASADLSTEQVQETGESIEEVKIPKTGAYRKAALKKKVINRKNVTRTFKDAIVEADNVLRAIQTIMKECF
jgi:hypothetical protein